MPHVEVIYHPFTLPNPSVMPGATPEEPAPPAGGAGPDAHAGAGGHDGASDSGGGHRRGAICALQSQGANGDAAWLLLALGFAALRRTGRPKKGGV